MLESSHQHDIRRHRQLLRHDLHPLSRLGDPDESRRQGRASRLVARAFSGRLLTVVSGSADDRNRHRSGDLTIASEVLLAAVDLELLKRFPKAKGRCVRYIDDVTLYASSLSMGVEFAEAYAEVLELFDLAINTRKTAHTDGVVPTDPSWRQGAHIILARLSKAGSDRGAVASALSDLWHLVAEHGEPPLHYVMTIASPRCASTNTWPVFQDFLTVAIRRDGLMLPHAHKWLLWGKSQGYIQSHVRLDENLHEFAVDHVLRAHAWEVAYIINILTDLGSTLDTDLAVGAAELKADIVDLLLLEATSKVRRLRGVRSDVMDRGAEPKAFTDGHWLLAYEVQRVDPARRTTEFSRGQWKNLAGSDISFFRDPGASPATRWYQARLALRTRRQSYVSL